MSEYPSYVETSPLFRLLRDEKVVAVIDVLLGKHYAKLTKDEIMSLTDLEEREVEEAIQTLRKAQLITESEEKRFQINKQTDAAKSLMKTRNELITQLGSSEI